MPPLELRAGTASAHVALQGAELVAWSVAGLKLLWTADPAWWKATSPILFPLVGRCRDGRYRIGSRRYAMGLHGFAAARPFAVVRQTPDEAVLQLADDNALREQYPFAFRLRVSYRLRPEGLDVRLAVVNPGPEPLPYAIGFHPGFAWPLDGGSRADAGLRFACAETIEVPGVTKDGLFSSQRRSVAFDGRWLPLSDDLFHADALCWFGANSRSARYESGDSAIRMGWRNLPHLALWSKPGAPFVCIEHWTGAGDPENFAGEITDKPGIRVLPPGARSTSAIRYDVEAPGHG